MAGVRVNQPTAGTGQGSASTTPEIDTADVDYSGGAGTDVRERQRFLLGGTGVGDDAIPVNAPPAATVYGLPVRQVEGRTLTERMFARAPQTGWSIWLDTADATNIYIAEAVSAETAGTATTFQGIRVQKDALGNPLGKVQVATGFAWNSRGAAAWT